MGHIRFPKVAHKQAKTEVIFLSRPLFLLSFCRLGSAQCVVPRGTYCPYVGIAAHMLGLGGDKHLGALGANCSEFVPSRRVPLLAGNINCTITRFRTFEVDDVDTPGFHEPRRQEDRRQRRQPRHAPRMHQSTMTGDSRRYTTTYYISRLVIFRTRAGGCPTCTAIFTLGHTLFGLKCFRTRRRSSRARYLLIQM